MRNLLVDERVGRSVRRCRSCSLSAGNGLGRLWRGRRDRGVDQRRDRRLRKWKREGEWKSQGL